MVRTKLICLIAGAAFALAIGGTGLAQSFEELDRLSDATISEQAALDLAGQQADRGEYLEALSTLERLLAVSPKSKGALLMHAMLLCQIEDRQGGRIELERLKKKDFEDGVLAEAYQFCGAEMPK